MTQYDLFSEPQDGGRVDLDYYPTPQWLIEAAVSRLWRCYQTILDAGSGDGRLAASVVDHRLPHPSQVTAVELHEERAAALPDDWEVVCASYPEWAKSVAGKRSFDLIITNPPFSRWLEFVDASLPLLAHNGVLLALGFSNILGSRKRAVWWQKHRPSKILQSPRRPQYKPGSNNGDPRETIWVQWGPGMSTKTTFDWLTDY